MFRQIALYTSEGTLSTEVNLLPEETKSKEFPTYTKGKSCVKEGRKHEYVRRKTSTGNWTDKCKYCGSTRFIRVVEKPASVTIVTGTPQTQQPTKPGQPIQYGQKGK